MFVCDCFSHFFSLLLSLSLFFFLFRGVHASVQIKVFSSIRFSARVQVCECVISFAINGSQGETEATAAEEHFLFRCPCTVV